MTVELQMLVDRDKPSPWMDQAIASALSAEMAVMTVSHIPGDRLAASRARGFLVSTAEYVGFLDSDDWLEPAVAKEAHELLKADPIAVGVFTQESAVDQHGNKIATPEQPISWCAIKQLVETRRGRHLCIFRRAALEPYLEEIAKADQPELYLIRGLLSEVGPWLCLPKVGYYHREHSDNAALKTIQENVNKHIVRLTPILTKASNGNHPMSEIIKPYPRAA